MNKRQKGKNFERKIAKYLESLGWKCEIARPVLQFIGPGRVITKTYDFWTCVDIISFHVEVGWCLIQACVNSNHVPERRRKLGSFRVPGFTRRQVWTKGENNRGYRVWVVDDCGSWTDYYITGKEGEWPVAAVLGNKP